jgi:hypothetical protein
MKTVTVFNPWTGQQSEKTAKEILEAIEVFASVEECESVNIITDDPYTWVKGFEKTHGNKRLSEIAFS